MTAKLPVPGKITVHNADDKTVSIVGYTGAAVDADDYGFPHPLVYDIENFTVSNHIPYSYEHEELMGHTLENKIHNGKMTNVAKHTVDSPTSEAVYQRISNGEKYQASMDAEFRYKDIVFIETGTVEINNKVHSAPIFVASKGRITEITVTKTGRDSETLVTKNSHYEEGRELLMKVKNSKLAYLDAYKDDPKASVLIENAKKESWDKEKFEEELAKISNSDPSTPPQKEWDGSYLLDYIDDKDAVSLIKNARKDKWEADRFKDELLRVKNATPAPSFDYLFDYIGDEEATALIPNARKEGWDKDKFEAQLQIVKVKNKYPQLPGIHVSQREGGEDVMKARMGRALDIPEHVLIKNTSEKILGEADKEGPLYIREALTMSCNANGGRFNGHSDVESMSKYMKRLVVSNSFSTVNFPNLMHHVASWKKEELWEIDKPECLEFCKVESEKDFRKKGHLKPRGGKVWEGFDHEGKLTHFTAGSEDTWTSEQKTVGQIVTFNREVVINDDMGWINDALTLMLEGAIMLPDYMFINLLYEANAQGVVNTSGANQNWFTLALTETNLATVYEAARRRYTDKDSATGTTTVNGTFNTRWALFHTSGLEQTAWDLIKQDRIVSNTTANTKQGDKNYWTNKFDLKLLQNLDNDTYHASADTDVWGLLPMRDLYKPFYVRYLNNQRSPVTETVDLPMDMLGFGVRGYWDINLGYRPVEGGKLQSFVFSNPA